MKLYYTSILWASLVTQMVKIAWNMGDPGSITGSGRFPREGNGNTLQYSCLENSMDRDMKLYLKNEMQTKIFSLIRFKIIVLNPEFNSYNS